jgi:hypothetical protein
MGAVGAEMVTVAIALLVESLTADAVMVTVAGVGALAGAV